MLISIVINADTRKGFNDEVTEVGTMFNGCRSSDFLTWGVWNKIQFFNGFKIELILYIDEHMEIKPEDIQFLKPLCTTLVVRKHTEEASFNDWNYLRALSLATGDIVVHFDQDTAAFTNSPEYVEQLIKYLDEYKFVSYPSHWTPAPVHDDSFKGLWWASTRFFMCRNESLKIEELRQCIINPEWMYEKYGDSPRRNNWTEHFIAKINGNSVIYPPVELQKGAIFSWSKYKKGTLEILQNMNYEEIKQWILHRGGIQYPVDIKCD